MHRAFLALMVGALFSAHGLAATIPLVNSVSIQTSGDSLVFNLQLAHVPDWVTLDQFNRQHEAFQFYLAPPGTSNPSRDSVNIVRGLGPLGNGGVTVCSSNQHGDNDCPGGWGQNKGVLPFQFDSDSLALIFSVPTALLDGPAVRYDIISLNFGAQNDFFRGTVDGGPATLPSSSVPECSSIALMLLFGLPALAGLRRR